MVAPVPLHANRGDGRTYTAADRRRSGKTSTHGGLTNGHLKLHLDLHQLDGRDPYLRDRLHYQHPEPGSHVPMEATVNPCHRGPVWMPITPKTGVLFHAYSHR